MFDLQLGESTKVAVWIATVTESQRIDVAISLVVRAAVVQKASDATALKYAFDLIYFHAARSHGSMTEAWKESKHTRPPYVSTTITKPSNFPTV